VISSIHHLGTNAYAVTPRPQRAPVSAQEQKPAQTISDGQEEWRKMAIMQTALTQLSRIEKSGVLEPVH
jgi:cell division protein FtsL